MKTSEAAAKRAQGLTGGMYGDEGENPFAGAIKQAIVQTGDKTIQLLDFEANAAGILIPEDASDEQVERLMYALFSIWDMMQIYIGDLLVGLDNRRHGETTDIALQFRRDPETLFKWKRICKSVQIRLRRRIYEAVPDFAKPLTITHYEIVMALSEEKQEQLLTDALRDGWNTRRLQKEARMVKVGGKPRVTDESDPAHPEHIRRVKEIQHQVKDGRYAEIDLGHVTLSIDWLEDIYDKAKAAQTKKK